MFKVDERFASSHRGIDKSLVGRINHYMHDLPFGILHETLLNIKCFEQAEMHARMHVKSAMHGTSVFGIWLIQHLGDQIARHRWRCRVCCL